MLRVIELIQGGAIAMVATEGLFQVILNPHGKVIGELLPKQEAEALRDTVSESSDGNQRAIIQSYADAFKISSN